MSASLSDQFGQGSPVVVLNGEPVAWIESPMRLGRDELAWQASQLERYRTERFGYR